MKTKGIILALIALAVPSLSWASAARSLQADTIVSPDLTKTFTLPSATTTLVGRDTTDTLTNKTINCSNNTCSNVPVSATMVQEIPTGTCNGATTAFTLANTPGGAASVHIFLDGLIQTQGAGKDYTISGASITLATACASGQTLYAVYSKF